MSAQYHAPEGARALLELAARQVLQQRDPDLFMKGGAMDPVELSADPLVVLKKTGGTTGHQQEGEDYIHYTLEIPALTARTFSLYVTRVSVDPVANRAALSRAIVWFIYNYYQASTFTRDEPAT
ncbi:hypothetical protein GSI_02587 [Ganoderma sinense ZZ0214-1]|uniref:Uncharacterized protein n=1 Tax=Ganoderma sinense ZZ0214-1 TaxID=1077348 RepID=A0A2G8SM26_9APHY|nr:hypothetical protein GSI_02587 [Ganoderma sinense ZZ0214-1]